MEEMDQKTLIMAGAATALAVGGLALYMWSGSGSGSSDTKKVKIPEAKALEKGKMKEVTVEVQPGVKKPILIVKTAKGKYHATGAKCTHYGASMANGVLAGDRVTCPWHAACFNVETGDIEDGPAIDKLPVYKTEVDGAGDVWVHLPKEAGKMVAKEQPHMCPASSTDARHFVIIGAGPCGLTAAETLRQQGYGGRITMLSKEKALPYDKTKLSKNMAVTAEDTKLRPREWFRENGIAVREGAVVTSVSSEAHTITLASGETLKYDKLLCASGGPARTFRAGEMFTTPGADLAGIFPLRDDSHSAGIEAAVDAAGPDKVRVVIVGSSFIGMEAAAYLINSKKVGNITVAGMESEPFERVLGPSLGRFMREVHEKKGVKFMMRVKTERYVGDAATGKVTGVSFTLPDGTSTVVPADVVILGAGIIPATEYLKDTKGVSLLKGAPGGVEVDAGMRVAGAGADPDIFAAGDIAYFPYCPPGSAKPHGTRIEHWDVAMDQGRVAAKNMLGQGVKYDVIPFFWTQQYGKSLRYAGHSLKTDDIILHGSTAEGADSKWSAYFVADGRVAAVATWNRDPQAVAAQELQRLGRMPEPDKLRGVSDVDLVALLHGETTVAAAGGAGGRRPSRGGK